MSSTPNLYELYHFTKSIPHDVYPAISPSNPALSVSGQTVLVTGGGQGIGLATAKYYAQAGAKNVIITGRTPETLNTAKAEIEKLTPETTVWAFEADSSSKDAVAKLWVDVAEKIGKVDVLINNAGRPGSKTKLGGGNVEGWLNCQEINLIGVYLMCEAYVASLSGSSATGTIVNVTSQAAFIALPSGSAYSISKLGVIRLTEFLHSESANIRAFSAHPGIIPTRLSSLGNAAQDTVNVAAGLNLYLASPRADFLRGRYVTANWDVAELEEHKDEILAENMFKIKLEATYGPEGHVWKYQK